MRKFQKLILGVILAGVVIAAPSNIAKAAGSVSVVGDKETAVVGDNYSVTVTVSDADGAAKAPDVSVNYDVNRLSFVDCSGSYGGGAGGFITLNDSETTINFTILSGGQADVDVTGIFEGEEANPQVVTASVMVEGEDTAAVNELARDDAGTGIEAGSIATADGNYVSSVFADEFMPVGFFKTTVSYEEQMVEAAQFDMGNIVLLYVTDATGNNGNFKIYDQATGELSDFLQISGIENKFIIALKAGPEVTVPDGFTKASLQWNDQVLEAYSYINEMPADATVPANEFFMLYAVSSEGNTGWYLYDQKDGTYQRFNSGLYSGKASGADEGLLSQITSSTKSEDGESDGINWLLIIVIGLGVLLLGLIITVIIMAVKIHEFNSYDYIDEDEDGEDNYLQRLAAQNEMGRNVNAGVGQAKMSQDEDIMNMNMPKTKNIYEQYREEDEKAEAANVKNDDRDVADSKNALRVDEGRTPVKNQAVEDDADDIEISDISSDTNRSAVARNERMAAEMYERDIDDEVDEDDEDVFSPRERSGKMSREEKKLMKQEEKARKKAEKKMKKEYGEFGPVDWQQWQDAVEGGERTAPPRRATAEEQLDVMEEKARRTKAEKPSRREGFEEDEEEFVRRPSKKQPRYEDDEEEFVRRTPKKQPRREVVEEEVEQDEFIRRPSKKDKRRMAEEEAYEEQFMPKDNPIDMMRNIPANDNGAPVQAKPVQQFDFDDDFEFEFLSLDDED